MSSTVHRTPNSGRQSLFLNDLASQVSSRKGKLSTRGQAAAVSALWRENFACSDLPPPPVLTLDDRSDFPPEMGIMDYSISPEPRSDPRTPAGALASGSCGGSGGKDLSTVSLQGRSEKASTSYAVVPGGSGTQVGSGSGLSLLSPGRSGGGGTNGGITNDMEEKGKGSPLGSVVEPGRLITLPPSREVARRERQITSFPSRSLDEEEWVTVYGFSPGDTNLVLREFEKCGVILKHIAGPKNANWIHVLYQNRSDAHKALSKDGIQISGVLIVGVKPVDPMQRRVLNERFKKQGFLTLPPPSSSQNLEPSPLRTGLRPYYLQNGVSGTRQSTGAIASPSKSAVSKIMDLVFGL